MHEHSSNTGRDMGRAHTQRSVEAVLTREIIGPYYGHCADKAAGLSTYAVLGAGQFSLEKYGKVPAWDAAAWMSEYMFDGSNLTLDENGLPGINRLISSYTFEPSARSAMNEGLTAQACFPLHLLHDIADRAEEKGVPGFEGNSLSKIAQMLKRQDIRGMIYAAAFTANGVWGNYSTSHYEKFFYTADAPRLDFAFSPDGSVDFTGEFKKYLLERMARVNKDGKPMSEVLSIQFATSSGCPALHTRAHFKGTQEDQAKLDTLSAYFNKSPEELLATHSENIITLGLDVLVASLEAMHERLEALKPPPTLKEKCAEKLGRAVTYVCTLAAVVSK